MKYSLKKDQEDSQYGYIDQNGVSYESPIQWLWIDILGGCGCGTSDRLAKRAWKVLSYFASDWDEREKNNYSVYTIPADELLAHWLTHKNLLEHGGSVGGSWLTEEGKKVYKIISSLLIVYGQRG